MSSNLGSSIFRTLAYFDLSGFPLTKEELWRFLWSPPRVSRGDFLELLDHFPGEEKNGFYFLPGRSDIVSNRARAVVPTDVKIKKARRAARVLKWIPFLKAVFVCNSVGRELPKPESDIDVFIITAANRLWIVRFFANFILRLFGWRTHGKKQRDRICLSFFVDGDNLDLSPWRVAPDDVHLAYWLRQMIAVYDENGWQKRFLAANRWLNEFLPHLSDGAAARSDWLSFPGRLWKRGWEKMWQGSYGDMVEKQARELQLAILSKNVKEKMNNGDNGVVVKAGIVKLHENDSRLSYRGAWQEKVKEYASPKIS